MLVIESMDILRPCSCGLEDEDGEPGNNQLDTLENDLRRRSGGGGVKTRGRGGGGKGWRSFKRGGARANFGVAVE